MKPLITMVVPAYGQPNMLRKQLQTWIDYPQDVYSAFRFIVVDDCSPAPMEGVFAAFGHPPGMSLYRIDKDIAWNRSMARNLGTTVAETEWVLHVDTDHVLPKDQAEMLIRTWDTYNDPARWYRFERYRFGAADETRKKDKVNPDLPWAKIHPHIDSYLCTKAAYWRAGGYNEDFSGVLGGGSPFLKEMEKANGPSVTLGYSLNVHTRHSVPDSSEHTLSRDPEAFKQRKREIMAKRGTLRGHDPLRLPWHKVF